MNFCTKHGTQSSVYMQNLYIVATFHKSLKKFRPGQSNWYAFAAQQKFKQWEKSHPALTSCSARKGTWLEPRPIDFADADSTHSKRKAQLARLWTTRGLTQSGADRILLPIGAAQKVVTFNLAANMITTEKVNACTLPLKASFPPAVTIGFLFPFCLSQKAAIPAHSPSLLPGDIQTFSLANLRENSMPSGDTGSRKWGFLLRL